jgi:hypothetical protein
MSKGKVPENSVLRTQRLKNSWGFLDAPKPSKYLSQCRQFMAIPLL